MAFRLDPSIPPAFLPQRESDQKKRARRSLSQRRHLLLFLLFIFSISFGGGAVGAETAQTSKPAKPNLSAAKNTLGKSEEPVQLQSDRLEYFKEQDLYVAEGSVVVVQGPLHLEADSLRLDNANGKLLAAGNVHFNDGENKTDADEVEMDINTKLGVLYDAKLFIKSDNYYVEGAAIERRALDRYELEEGSFTACNCPEDPDWKLKARKLRIHMDHYLVARDVVFYANGIPVFYLPYLIYPVKTERQSGFMIPRLGFSSRYGLRYEQDFYWVIARNQDATITADHRGSKGDGLGLQYRYVLSEESRGELNTDYFYDRENKVSRWDLQYQHQQRFTDRITGKIDLRYLNQKNNLLELSDQTLERAQQNIESNVFVTYRGDESFAYFLARYTQNLTTAAGDTTVQRLPEIGYSYIEHRLGNSPFFFNFDSTATNFWRSSGLKADRVDLYPKLSMPVPLAGAVTVTPWAGFRETWYSRGTLEEAPIGREAFPAGVNLESRFYRQRGETLHVVTPSLHYEYISVEDQPETPQFDEVDRIHDLSAVTLSIAQRFLKESEKGTPLEKIYFRVTETYRIDEARSAGPDRRPYSDLRTEWAVRPFSQVTVTSDSFYNLYDRRISTWNTDLLLDLLPHLNFSVGQRYTHAGFVPQKGDLFNPLYLGDREAAAPIKFWTGRILVKTPWGITLVNRAYFDQAEHKFVEIDYGIQYESQCWGVTLAYLDLQRRNEFSFMVNLKGLGNTASRKFANLF
jgi:LPS-assembly protein